MSVSALKGLVWAKSAMHKTKERLEAAMQLGSSWPLIGSKSSRQFHRNG